MKTNLEDISAVKKKLTVEIEAEEVDNQVADAYKAWGKRAKLRGFRQGKVPRKILETHFGDQIIEDVTQTLVSETLTAALAETETLPLGTPLLEKEPLKKGQSFTYTAIIEVRPQFELNDYLGLALEKEKCSITQEDVLNRLEQIREANGKLVSVEEPRPIRTGDIVVLDYEGFEEGILLEGAKSSNLMLKVGAKDFHPAFEQALVGLNKDAETEITVDFEQDYHYSKLAGKHVTFKVKIIDIKDKVLPGLDDEFAQSLGTHFADLEGLKTKLKETLVAEEEKRIDNDLKRRLLEKISEGVDFELPQVLVDSQLTYAVENVSQNLLRSGSSLEKAGISTEKLRADFRPASEKRVKELLLLGEIANKDEITIDDDELAEQFENLASGIGQDPEALQKYYEANNLLNSMREKLLEEKTLNYLVQHANITEVEKGMLSQKNSPKKENG
jgi:trigger factor